MIQLTYNRGVFKYDKKDYKGSKKTIIWLSN